MTQPLRVAGGPGPVRSALAAHDFFACVEDLEAELIRAALVAPKRRVATKPTLGSRQRRLKAKAERGEVKAMRGKVDED